MPPSRRYLSAQHAGRRSSRFGHSARFDQDDGNSGKCATIRTRGNTGIGRVSATTTSSRSTACHLVPIGVMRWTISSRSISAALTQIATSGPSRGQTSSSGASAPRRKISSKRMHDLVCSGQADLRQAQHEIAGDWQAAYRKYFQQLTYVCAK